MNNLDHIFAQFAALAYPSRRAEVAVPDGWECLWIDHKDVQGVYAWNRDLRQRILAIAGTNEPNDFVSDVNFIPRSIIQPNGETLVVHDGFWAHADQLAGYLSATALIPDKSDFPLTIVGHSLGGAVAGMIPLFRPQMQFHRIVTFGCPRWLRKETAGNYMHCDRTTRYVRPMDLVPDVPLNLNYRRIHYPIGGWSHCGSMRWLMNDGKRIPEHTSSWDIGRHIYRTLVYLKTFPWNFDDRLKADHDVVNQYLRCMRMGV